MNLEEKIKELETQLAELKQRAQFKKWVSLVDKPTTFTMGEGEKAHSVTLTTPFEMCATQVTQKEWVEVMGENPSYFIGDDLPVECVSYNDVMKYIEKLNASQSEYVYRLPTEAEWEYACRAGSNTKYCFGDDEDELEEYAWYHENSDNKTHPVAEKKPNAFGLYDMHGNVWEWCSDVYEENYGRG